MEQISVFDIIKIGIGPSSSHTMGPWRAAERSLKELVEQGHQIQEVSSIKVDLYGSLAKTGKGHGTDVAVILGLLGEDPITMDISTVHQKFEQVCSGKRLHLAGLVDIPFDIDNDLHFNFQVIQPFHPNGIRFTYRFPNDQAEDFTYFSIGGGFVVTADETFDYGDRKLPFPIQLAEELLVYCDQRNQHISDIVLENEKVWRTREQINEQLDLLWHTMRDCIYMGCTTEGELPGGLNVKRRAASLNRKLLADVVCADAETWMAALQKQSPNFQQILKWVSCFAIATNEQNAAFGRVVTAPTNGASGVIPAVLCYMICFTDHRSQDDIRRFLLVAGELGSIFKKGATISAALGGCQAEIGVSSAMAAGALTECLGGSPGQALMAAEIAMEHHLGLTCDPVGGLVQIPCIERNSMGAIKAITAANIAIEGNPLTAKVSLDSVIKSMWETALDMNDKYKETSEGGLAVNIGINVVEC